jgi:hypothetical protein
MLHMTAKQDQIRASIRENKATLDRAESERNELIAGARRAGVPWKEICEDAGLVRMTAGRYASEANGGKLPKPGDPAPRKSRKKSA